MHPGIQPLAFLVGTWEGAGAGEYPTIEPFTYWERITFTPGPDKPFLSYSQVTKDGSTGLPLHAESGYVRSPNGRVEWVIAQPTGLAEVLEGDLDGTSFALEGFIRMTGTATEVDSTERRVEVDGDVLRYRLAMAAVGQPMTHHLSAELRRVVPD